MVVEWNENELEQRNRACSSCAVEKRAKNPDKPILPVDLLEYSPGEYLTSDLFEIEKKIFITVTDRLSGLILGDRVEDKSAAETTKALESIFIKLGPPSHMRTDNCTNFSSEKFAKLMQKYGIHHTSCSPEYHQGNGAAEKSVDTLKKMLRKTGKNSDIRELCYKLNCRIRPGAGCTPMEAFFGKRVKSDLPNAFAKECAVMTTIEKRIRKQFDIARRRRQWSRDTFSVNDRVRVRDGKGKWSILGRIEEAIQSPDGTTHTYQVRTDDGRTFTRNGSWIHHSESNADTDEERAEA